MAIFTVKGKGLFYHLGLFPSTVIMHTGVAL